MGFSFTLVMLYNRQVNDKQEQITSLQNLIITRNYSHIQPSKTATATPDSHRNLTNTNADKRINAPIAQAGQSSRENIIQDIFGAETGSSDSKNTIDDIKSRYEELIVTYLIMEKCNIAKASDYQLIMAALQKEIIAAQAPVRLQYDILTAAKGSYEGLYAANDCQKPDFSAASSQYMAYIEKLSENSATR